MKKLATLASIAVLLCASASFAKKALDEEEMDLVTAAGQPTVIDIKAEGDGTSSAVTSDTKASTYASADATTGSASIREVSADGISGELNADIESLIPPNIEGDLQVNFADTEIESFSLSGSGSLTATSSVESETEIELGSEVEVDATTEDNSNWSLLVNSGSQENLRALALNNVAGENQLASAFNIEAGANNSSGSQSNTINQSWGSTYDWSFAPGTDGGEGGDATAGSIASMAGSCVFGPCNDASAKGGEGGDGASAIPLTITGDKIIRIEAENENGNLEVDAHEIDKSLVSAIIDTDSQSNLAALAVNNLVGRNQVATAVNTASNGGAFLGNSAGKALVAFDGVQQGQASFNQAQSNTINQYRGTPFQQ